jgi:hypothetical protein
MAGIIEALENNKQGFCFGNRVLLPFHGYILKIVVDNDIIMDFSRASREAVIGETDVFTEIYFLQHENLKHIVGRYETIKLLIVEKGKDVFDLNNHIKLLLRLGEDHKLTIEKTDEDTLFIE